MREQVLREQSRIARLVLRARPSLAGQSETALARGYEYTLLTLYLGPIALIAVVWLALVTDWARLLERLPYFLVLLVALLVMSRQTFGLIFALDDSKGISIISSLSNLALWAGLLIAGPGILWAPLLTALISRLGMMWQLRRYNQDPLWEPLSYLVQDMVVDVFAPLVALTVYVALGGTFPLTAVSLRAWGLAFVAMMIAALLPGILLLLPMQHVTRLLARPFSLQESFQFLGQATALSLIMSPFAVLVVLVFAHGGLGAFIFFIVGILLVNLLAATLSRMAERSRQRTRELARLEDLSEAILQAAPDASALPDILADHLARMFPDLYDLAEIYLFPADGRAEWHILHPSHKPPLPPGDWADLCQSNEAYLVQRDVVLPGMHAPYGHGLLVKIPEIVPGQESAESACLGGVYLLRHRRYANTLDSLAAVQALASQIGSALYRARVHRETVAHQKVAQELEFAGRIQTSFLPRTLPLVPGWDIAATLVPARQTSGDFYDFMELGDGRLGLLVADVADKGTGAALYMALSRTLIRTYALDCPDEPERALQLANERILSDTESDQFVTLFYGVLDPAAGTLTYSNAGHNPAFLLDARGARKTQALGQTGIPLGMFPGMSWRREVVAMQPDDILVMYTDGVPEAQDGVGAEFGEQRLLTAVQSHQPCAAKEMETAVLSAIQTFVGEAPQFDDITLLIVRKEGEEAL